MSKRVLGDDPFATGKDDESAGKKQPPSSRPSKNPPPGSKSSKSAAPAGGKRPSTAAPSRTSKRPPAPTSRRAPPSARAAAGAPTSEPASEAADITEQIRVRGPKDAGIPREALALVEDADTTAEEATVDADLPPDLSREREEPVVNASAEPASGQLEDQIKDLEEHLDRLLEQVADRGADKDTLDRVAQRLRARMGDAGADETAATSARGDQNVFDVARELLSSDYYLRQWGRVAMRDRTEEVDDFGLDPKFAARVRPLFDFLYERWWRVETHDIDRVPNDGRVVIVANHSGAVPYDGAMLAAALRREHPAHREMRWLAEDFVFHFPFLGVFMNRIGAVRACQENAERLLRKNACVGVFPEGVKGIAKLYRDRYKLQRFGRGGHVKLAIRTRTPIVPVAILGAEETHPMIAPTGMLAKFMGMPYVPVTPTFPFLGALGLVPMPSKWKIFFLEPISMEGYGPEAADDDVLVGRLNEKIRSMIQDELDRAVRERQSVFKG